MYVVLVSCQAFLEMNSEEAAQNMVGYYSTVMPIIRHYPVFVQFSNHKELKTDNSPNQEVILHVDLFLPALVCSLCSPVSESSGSSEGPQLIAYGRSCSCSEHSATGRGGEPGLSGHAGRTLPGNNTAVED